MNHNSSSGVYDQAIEASAEKLMFAAREMNAAGIVGTLTPSNNSSSGYASDDDANTLDSQDTGNDAVSFVSSSLSKSGSDESFEEDDSIESEIAFLQEKQTLLQRALTAMKREDIYNATKARDVVNGNLPAEALIWQEAREVLDVLKNGGEGSSNRIHVSDESAITWTQNTTRRPNKRPRIDVSSVICHSATEADDHPMTAIRSGRVIANKQVLCAGHWVAQAMAQAFNFPQPGGAGPGPPMSPSSNNTWEIMNDPDLGPLVVPPPKLELKIEVQLKDALSFTPTAQLITLSTPPFFVVHANKAFSMFSGLQTGDVVGKPVDSVLQITNGLPQQQRKNATLSSSSSRPTSSSSPFRGNVLGSGKQCQVLLTPISDHQRWISHLLVKVEQAGSPPPGSESRGFELVEIVPEDPASSNSASSHDTSRASSRHSHHHHHSRSLHHGYGTVG